MEPFIYFVGLKRAFDFRTFTSSRSQAVSNNAASREADLYRVGSNDRSKLCEQAKGRNHLEFRLMFLML